MSTEDQVREIKRAMWERIAEAEKLRGNDPTLAISMKESYDLIDDMTILPEECSQQ